MDKFLRWLETAQRRHPHYLPLRGLFYHPRKTDRIRSFPSRCNITLLLDGRGEFRDGKLRSIEGPCLFIQRADVPHEYGPVTTWEELSLVYAPEAEQQLEQAGYLRRHYRPIQQIGNLMPLIRQLLQLGASSPSTRYTADRIDRLADLLLLETVAEARPVWASEQEGQVWKLRESIDAHPERTMDFGAWPREHGMSDAVFRRLWSGLSPLPPQRYQQRARHRVACRLLVESDLSISQIASEAGYNDPLYFSRVFHKLAGFSPRQFRNKHQGLHGY